MEFKESKIYDPVRGFFGKCYAPEDPFTADWGQHNSVTLSQGRKSCVWWGACVPHLSLSGSAGGLGSV